MTYGFHILITLSGPEVMRKLGRFDKAKHLMPLADRIHLSLPLYSNSPTTRDLIGSDDIDMKHSSSGEYLRPFTQSE